MRFEGTNAYVATDDLKVAVNAAIALERPLLVKGEPGTGKTVLGEVSFDAKGDVTGYAVAGVKKDRYVLYTWKKGPDGKISYFENQ